jgi:hypothetical protein
MTLISRLEQAEAGSLIKRIEALGKYGSNELDVEIDIALFKPSRNWRSVRANAAGTKLIYTDCEGDEYTFRAEDRTMKVNRAKTIASLKAAGYE